MLQIENGLFMKNQSIHYALFSKKNEKLYNKATKLCNVLIILTYLLKLRVGGLHRVPSKHTTLF